MVDVAHEGPTLAELDEDARNAVFDRLQARMPEVWQAFRRDDPRESVVVVPSMTLDRVVANSGGLSQALEERFLFFLLLLRQPRLRMVYVTSQPVNPLVVEYYLSLLPGVIPSHARARLSLVSVDDSGPEPLTEKVLARPRLVARIRDLVPDRSLSHLVPYNTTSLERDLAVLLGIPMYGADPRLFPLGTKTGCRRLFARAGVPHPAGAEDLHTRDDLVAALLELRGVRPGIRAAMVKLNEGVSGAGNAVVDLAGLPEPGSAGEAVAVGACVDAMELEDTRIDVGAYLAKLAERGGIVEERVVGDEIRSPSVQLRVTPLGEVEVLSTHDQVLGGPSGQSYLGCRFPADAGYARLITRDAERIGELLAREGVLGRFAVDFVTVRRGEEWEAFAIEVNLRKGGTTHPFLTLQFLTDGRYDPETGRFRTPSGEERHLVATDHLEDPSLRGLRVEDLFDLVARSGLHFDQARQIGVVFHMLSAITAFGRVGLTAIAPTPDAAQRLLEDAEGALREEARAALAPQPVPT
ncbi:peptide ligase PGM1-related protein [Fodinibacter luteus]|uniref:Peptide ligase PGM1-related protein n=1 Tax=Fodinibacter luteus TaxID=552064 RepID=A0ABP8KPM1_9MICO